MTVNVPRNYILLVKYASIHTGLPYQVVACQANLESGFNANAVSPAGAEGWLQFLPSTFAEYGHGSPFNPQDEMYAYVNFMNQLLRDFGGNVRYALAAYNAGPGNVRAGLGYADTILSCAGSSNVINVKPQPGSKPSGVGPSPSSQGDDWSWWVGESSIHFSTLGNRASVYGNAIRGL